MSGYFYHKWSANVGYDADNIVEYDYITSHTEFMILPSFVLELLLYFYTSWNFFDSATQTV